MDGEIIASMGESRIGDEHTEEDDDRWRAGEDTQEEEKG